jgi:hypothetical protein
LEIPAEHQFQVNTEIRDYHRLAKCVTPWVTGTGLPGTGSFCCIAPFSWSSTLFPNLQNSNSNSNFSCFLDWHTYILNM